MFCIHIPKTDGYPHIQRVTSLPRVSSTLRLHKQKTSRCRVELAPPSFPAIADYGLILRLGHPCADRGQEATEASGIPAPPHRVEEQALRANDSRSGKPPPYELELITDDRLLLDAPARGHRSSTLLLIHSFTHLLFYSPTLLPIPCPLRKRRFFLDGRPGSGMIFEERMRALSR